MSLAADSAGAELVVNGSVELSHAEDSEVRQGLARLPYATRVMVPCLPSQPFESRAPIWQFIGEHGCEPVPHLPARQVVSRHALSECLEQAVAESSVQRILLIGGDRKFEGGPFADSQELLESGLLAEAGIREVGFAAYPEGHPAVSQDALLDSLAARLSRARDQELGTFIVTQFTLLPQRITPLCARLAERLPDTPIYAGIPGPATHEQLVHFARYCGVSTALSAVSEVGVRLAQVVDHERSGQQLRLIAAYNAAHAASNIVGVHVYSFGGFDAATRWIRSHSNPSA
ncbi:MAG: methylenetetrahydrofolate reductase [Xanthomonadales bacterium]|nr:methylenetetrahydrofolate reductase [Xanthomonadales bacterium]